jgi:S1-C subfamily serine protease
MALERYVSPDGKYAVEIDRNGGAFARSQVYVGLASSRDRQLLGDFDLPVQGSPKFFKDNRFLVVHTGTLSSGTWPIIFQRKDGSVFERAFEFTGTEACDALKTLKKLPSDYRLIHLYIEATGFREPDILELSFRGDDGRMNPFKPATLDFSLTARKYLETDRSLPGSRVVPRMAGQGLTGYGTGFFVHIDGWIVTCDHVISGADLIKVLISTGETLPAVTVEQDPEHDLALLHVSGAAPGVVPISANESITLGEEIYTLGFPVPNLQGFNPKLTSGIVSSLTGLMDDPYVVQISAPIQPGNSGGPVISCKGPLIGVASSSVKPKTFLEMTGSFPQNINYAIRTELVHLLLERQKIAPVTPQLESQISAIQNLTKSTVLILTYALPDTLRQTHLAQQERP